MAEQTLRDFVAGKNRSGQRRTGGNQAHATGRKEDGGEKGPLEQNGPEEFAPLSAALRASAQ